MVFPPETTSPVRFIGGQLGAPGSALFTSAEKPKAATREDTVAIYHTVKQAGAKMLAAI